MNVVDEVRCYLTSEAINSADAIVVGLSAGPDSTALIHILCEIRDGADDSFPNIYAVHVNHNLRPGDCDKDSLMAQQMCEKLGVPIKTYSVDIAAMTAKTGRSEEETGRIERYRLFEAYINDLEEKNVLLAVAHHRGDVAETMLMNLFRGSGLDGLVSPKRVNGNIIRPLLNVTKADLIKYLDERDISYAIDSTNAECDHTRNMWRNELLPKISEVSVKKPEDALWETYELLDADLKFIMNHVSKVWDENSIRLSNGYCFPVDKIQELDRAISSRIIRMLRYKCVDTVVNFGSIHVSSVMDLISSAKTSLVSIDMPFETVALICNGLLSFAIKDNLNQCVCDILSCNRLLLSTSDIDIRLGELLHKNSKIPNSNIQIRASIVENSKAIEYNSLSWCIPYSEDALERIRIANHLPDTKFSKAGSGCSKQLSRLMTDAHIPSQVRGYVVGVVEDGQSIWVPGIGHADGFVSEASYAAWIKSGGTDGRFIRIEIIREGNNG